MNLATVQAQIRRFAKRVSWQSEEFELVTVSTPAGTDEQKISVITPSSSSNVALLAKTDDDVLNWISKNKDCYTFCFPTESAGPTIILFCCLVSDIKEKSGLLIALQAKRPALPK
jgi:hypothetical protein